MLADAGNHALEGSDERFQLLVDSIDDYAIYMLDPIGHVITWNTGAALMKGYHASEVLGRHFRIFFVPEDVDAQVPEVELAEANRSGRRAGEGWRLRKNGERFWASFVITAIRDPDGRLSGFAKITRDRSEAKRQQDALRGVELGLREERDCLYTAAECTMDALFVCNALRGADGQIQDFIFTYLNNNVDKMVTIPRSALLGSRMCEMFPFTLTLGLFETYKQVVRSGEPIVLEVRFDERSVKAGWLRMQIVKVGDGIAISASDITTRKEDEDRAIRAAYHDSLTGLPNRSLLRDRIGQAIERAKRFGGKVAVFMVDLDSFKHINDTHGHAAGDAVLVNVAVRLKAAVRATDSVIRNGGDEFVVVMPDISDPLDIESCANKILESLQSAMEVDGRSIRATCSLGVAVYPDTAQSVADLLAGADAAMYAAKRAGKNQFSTSAPKAPQEAGARSLR
jgi:diguanylate cyclase (GGDEF)-like protein/PAS domain S-box-containing protein